MKATEHPFITIENHQKGDKSGYHTFANVPDYHQAVPAKMAEFIWKASQVLTEFRANWVNEHSDDHWARGLEMDIIPITTDGMVAGYMVISEIDGESYEYAPTKQINNNNNNVEEST